MDRTINSIETTPPKKRRFSFSLRTLMLFFTVCCLFLGWWTNSAQRQKRVVAWVEEQGGSVQYDWQDVPPSYEPREPNWLSDLLGVDYFHAVIEVITNDTKTSDISPLADLKNLRYLNLNGTQVSDLSPLADLKDLNQLYIENTQVSELSPLANKKYLFHLYIYNTPVSEEEIRKLKISLPEIGVRERTETGPI